MRTRHGWTLVAATGLLLCGLAAPGTQASSSTSSSASLKLVSGTVTSISDQKVVVRTSDGDEMTFDLNSLTHKPATLRVGDRVQIDYEDGWTSDTATRITAMSSATASSAPPASGGMHGSSGTATTQPSTVSTTKSYSTPSTVANNDPGFEPLQATVVSLSDDRIVVRAPSGENRTFLLDPGQRDRMSVKVGDWVAVNYDDRSGQQYATRVVLSPGERGFDASIGDYRNQDQYRASNQNSNKNQQQARAGSSSYSSGPSSVSNSNSNSNSSASASASSSEQHASNSPTRSVLPQTASPLALLALGGLLALCAAGVIGLLRLRG